MTAQNATRQDEQTGPAGGTADDAQAVRQPLLLSRFSLALMALIGVGLSLLLYLWLFRDESQRLAHEIEDRAEVQTALIELELTGFFDRVEDNARLFLSFEAVTAREFEIFNGAAREEEPAVAGFAWAPRVAADTDTQTPPRYPLTYLASPGGLPLPLGVDMGGTETGRALLRRAQATGRPAVSGLVRSQGLPGLPPGIMLAAPVIRAGDAPAVPAGFVLGFVATDPLVTYTAARSGESGVDFLFADDGAPDDTQAMGALTEVPSDVAAFMARPFSVRMPLRLAERRFTLLAAPTPAFIAAHRTIKPLGGGLLALALTTALVLWLLSARRRAELMQRQVEFQQRMLQAREAEFAAAFAESPLGCSIATADGRLMRVNDPLCRMLGRPMEAVIGHSYAEFTHPDDLASSAAAIRQLTTGERTNYAVVKRYQRPDGEVVWAKVVVSPIREADGTLRCLVALMEDITAWRRLQSGLEEAEARWRFALEGADHGVWDWDARTHKVFFSRRWKEMLGYAESEIGDSFDEWESRVHPDDLPLIHVALEAHFNGKTAIYLSEHRLRCKDGRYTWVLDRGKVVERAEDGSPRRVIGTHTDISAMRAMVHQTQMRARVIEAINVGRSLEAVLTIMIEALEAYMSDWLCSVLLLEEDGVHLRHCAAASLPADYVAAIDGVAIGPLTGSCGAAIFHNRREITPDLSVAPGWAPFLDLARSAGLASCWSQPIQDPAGRAVGSFAVYHRSVCEPSPLDLEFVDAAAQLAGLAIERSRASEDLARHRSMLSALGALQRDFIGSARPAAAHDQLLELACRLTGSTIGFIGVVDRDRGDRPMLRLHAVHPSGAPTDDDRIDVALPQAVRDAVFDRGETLIANDPLSEIGCDVLWSGGPVLHAFIGLPVYANGQLVQLMGLANRPGGYETRWRDRLEPLISTLTAIIAAGRMQERQFAALRAQASAEAASKAKSQFLANVSHELRTPMNAIIGLTTLCLKTPLDARQSDYLHKVADAARGLMDVISDVLDFSKIEADRVELDAQPFVLTKMVGHVMGCFEEPSRAKGIALSAVLDPGIPPVLRGDKVRLAQVLINLVGNAVKFTKAGQVSLDIDLISAEAASVRLRFVVRDTGIGIRSELFDRLFDPFEQADVSATRAYGGTGLGLSISQRLVTMMGGRIAVCSEVGQGAEFSFEIVLPIADEAALAQPTPMDNADSLAGHTVLVIEDQPLNRQVVAELLLSEGMVVRLAESGEAGLALLEGVDLVLTDIQMPGLDGYETVRRIRAMPAYQDLPVIAFTANALSDEHARCEAAGMDDLLTKPVDPDLMLKLIGRWLARGRAPSDQVSAAPAPDPEFGRGLDLKVGLHYARNKPDFYRRLLSRFADNEADAVSRMTQLLADGDIAGAERTAHSMKGMAATLGAESLRRVAADLECRIREQGGAVDPACAEELAPPLAEVLAAIAGIEADPGALEAFVQAPA